MTAQIVFHGINRSAAVEAAVNEKLEAMYKVGKRLPVELRETALSGCATTPSACEACHIHA